MTERGEVHVPVLPEETASLLGGRHANQLSDGWIADVTLGAGGHSALLLGRFPRLRLLGMDQDPEILSVARERLEPFQDRVRIEHRRMSELDEAVRDLDGPLVGVLMDLGASSLQLDSPTRGFSFQRDAALDMRMDPRRETTAADIVNDWSETELADLFFHEGDERASRRVAKAIVEARRRVPFRRTRALADLVDRTVGGGGKIHGATRVFQALRRAVNEEGPELEAGLAAAHARLAHGGVLAAISFHSGEDRVVKHTLAAGMQAGDWESVGGPWDATSAERRANPRARSARLRGARRLRGHGGGGEPSVKGGHA